MSRLPRFGPRRLTSGVVVSGGVDLHPVGAKPSLLASPKGPARALVVASRMVGDEGNRRGISVECDVILVRTEVAIQNVPVVQRAHGVNNAHDLWVPQPATRRISNPSLPLNLSRTHSRRGTPIGAPQTPLGDTDGDMVLVDWLEGNADFPVIVGALPHELTNRVVRAGAGWREGSSSTRGNPRPNEFYVHHMGTEVRINEQGDLLVDTVGAYDDGSTEDTSAEVGQVRIRVKGSKRFTVAMGDDEDVLQVYKTGGVSPQLRVDLGKNADQRIPLGDDQVAAIKRALDAVLTFAQGMATATPAAPNAALTVASVLALYGTGPGIPGTLLDELTQAKADLEAALSSVARTKKT